MTLSSAQTVRDQMLRVVWPSNNTAVLSPWFPVFAFVMAVREIGRPEPLLEAEQSSDSLIPPDKNEGAAKEVSGGGMSNKRVFVGEKLVHDVSRRMGVLSIVSTTNCAGLKT